jgi:hypothetical protein
MKKPKTVVVAEAALAAKIAESAAAKEEVRRLDHDLNAAYAAVHQAQTDADAALPQCRMVRVQWRTGVESGMAPYVIVRRTPTGMLVVRRVGGGGESTFRWSDGQYKQAEKYRWGDGSNELRDVPAEYLPKDGAR